MAEINNKNSEIIFEARQISKRFGPTIALEKVDLSVYRGEITGLIGENGSGKSTLATIAAGMQPANSGEMFFLGKPHKPSTMIDGAKAGIGMIVQEMGTVSGISVSENIFLGEEEKFKKFGLISKKLMNQACKEALQAIGSDIEPSLLIDRLGMQERKLVELAKVIYAQPEMLIIDETTTALSHHGREILYKVMQKMKAENKAVLFISHDLPELMEVCDTLIVLRDGKLVDTLAKADMSEKLIKRLLVGREMSEKYYRDDYDGSYDDEVVLKAINITTATGLLENFSMELHKGEILGVGGLSHCGMHELGKALFGEARLLTGSVFHLPSNEEINTEISAMEHQIGYVSKNRDVEALVLTASIRDNIVAAAFDKVTSAGGFILPSTEKKYVNAQVDSLEIKCASINQNVQYLSGGNKQKVVFGKWVGRDCDILILDCPTRGVDVGVKAAMYDLFYEMKQEGKSILLISEELTELIGMSDRLLILKDGKQTGEFVRSESLSETDIIDVMI
jgi:ribose transport system ATP-binding protein